MAGRNYPDVHGYFVAHDGSSTSRLHGISKRIASPEPHLPALTFSCEACGFMVALLLGAGSVGAAEVGRTGASRVCTSLLRPLPDLFR